MEQIENIKKKVDEIKNSLNELKNNVSLSDIEKKNQAECLKAQAEATKQRIEIEINNLDNETKTEAQNLLNKSMDDITSLYNSIVNTTASVKPLTENKNIFVKAKDWIGKQRYDIRDKKKWENETGKNILRTTGFIASGAGAIALAYKGVKKLRNRAFSNNDASEKGEGEKRKEKKGKKSFWKTTGGKILKWLGIGSAAGRGIYGISKRLRGNRESSVSTPTNTPSSNTATGNIDYSKVDTSGFTPGPYPFKHITTPYQGIEAYRVDNIRLNPLIGFNQLSLKGTEGDMITLNVKEEPLHYDNKNAAGYKKNNPCNVSPYKGDIGRISSSKVADGQNHGGYKSMEDGLASFMKLMREGKDRKGEYMYRNKSIQGINCSGMQGVYSQNEPDSLKALRIIRITRACSNLQVSPFTRLNTDDKETMMAFTQQTAINESGSHFDRATLERAYEKAFG